ncbi:Retrovirus-related Pol polyprotein from transposon TNT 1-94 [Sesbania bispinosa]|nr:Retrovirus-related Pol polyprotein from transposon TNT 1-94 [Sesbania bispinosa]
MTKNTSRFVPQTNFYNPVSDKLDENNFLVWKHQAINTIKGYKLQKFITGDESIPRKFLTDEDEELENLNTEFID